jgi:hypothetical protein
MNSLSSTTPMSSQNKRPNTWSCLRRSDSSLCMAKHMTCPTYSTGFCSARACLAPIDTLWKTHWSTR